MDKPQTAATATAGWAELFTAEQAPRLLLVCLGVWLHAADELVAATMSPSIVAELGGAEMVSWIFALYETGSIVAGAASALLALRFGLSRPMTVAATLFALGCLVSALTPSMEVMLVGRVLQGLGGGGLVSMSFVAVGALFTPAQLPRVMATMSALWGASSFLGPLIGGLFADAGIWRGAYWFFAVQALLLATLIAARARLLSIDRVASDLKGAPAPVLRLAALSAAVVAISAGGLAERTLVAAAWLALGLGLLWLFFRLDGRRGAGRLLPPAPLSLRHPAGAALAMVLAFCLATVGFFIYGPILLSALHGLSALQTGFLLALASIGWSLGAIAVSGAPARRDPFWIMLGMSGLALSEIGFLLFAVSGPIWLIGLLALLEGAGFGVAWTFILRRTQALAPAAERARIAGALSMIQRLGYALGAAGVGVVANAVGFADEAPRAVIEEVGFWVFAAALPCAAFGLFAAWRFTRFPAAAAAV